LSSAALVAGFYRHEWNRAMKTVGQLRRENLELLLREFKTLDALAVKAGTSSVYLSQVRNQTKDASTGKPREMGPGIARRLETAASLPIGWMDREQPAAQNQDESAPLNEGKGNSPSIPLGAQHNVSSALRIPTAMPYTPDNLKSAILLMGSLLGVLDLRSRIIIGDLLKDLAEHTDDAQDIAAKASALASVQRPISGNRDLDRAIKGRKGIAQTE